MKIIRAHGGKAELQCLYGGGWYWSAHAKRENVPLHAQRHKEFTVTNVSMSGVGYAPTMRDARRMALNVLTPWPEGRCCKAREMFGVISYG